MKRADLDNPRSCGGSAVAELPAHLDQPVVGLDLADRRLYAAKHAGRARSVWSEDEVLAAYADRASEILADSLEGWSDEDLSRFSRDLARFAGDLESALEQTIEHRG